MILIKGEHLEPYAACLTTSTALNSLIAAMSGSQPKAPGFAEGCLLDASSGAAHMHSNNKNKKKSLISRCYDWLKKPAEDKLVGIMNIRDRAFERKYDLEFNEGISSIELFADFGYEQKHASDYVASNNIYVRTLISEAIKTGIRFNNFVDVGCGKGKACIYAKKEFGFDEIIGVDLSERLIEMANKNKNKCQLNTIRFIAADASCWLLPSGNSLVYLYNPFDDVVIEKFLLKNLGGFQETNSVIAYANDVYRNKIVSLGFETIFRNQTHRTSLYKYINKFDSKKILI